ncbi:MAG: N-acetylglucosamine-6-phosphate deacetylase [Chloroflexota bacterium]|nr:N-acetylglucosamine-6-phosphate deacetylase [Chloroflexota bacterium]
MDRLSGRLILDDQVVPGKLTIENGLITDVAVGADSTAGADPTVGDTFISPGFVDVHVHGWGGHSAMGDRAALDGMARTLLRRGVTSFLPTAVSAPLDELAAFADRVRAWLAVAPGDGAEPLGFNLEGPFLADSRRGAHDPAFLVAPEAVSPVQMAPLLDGLRVITIAPELRGAWPLIASLARLGVVVSLGHSAANLVEARDGYEAGARSTTHLFNAMTGVDHRAPGLAVAALLDDRVYTELIADGIHVDAALWPLITRLKPAERLLLVSDAIPLAGTGDGRGRLGSLEIEIVGERVTLAGTNTLAGSVLALDVAVRNMVDAGIALPAAVAAATRNPLELLGINDRGRLAAGQRADLVELDANLNVRRVMRAGEWLA